MIVTLRLLTKAGAYLASKAKRMAQSLSDLPGKTGKKYQVVDGFLLSASKLGKRTVATVMDLPVYFVIYAATFSKPGVGVPVHRSTSDPLPPAPGLEDESVLWGARYPLQNGRDVFLEKEAMSEELPDYSKADPSFYRWVYPDGAPFTIEPSPFSDVPLHRVIVSGTATPFGRGALLSSDTVALFDGSHGNPDRVLNQLTAFTQWSTEFLWDDPDVFNPPVMPVHRVSIRTAAPPLEDYPSGSRIAGLALSEDYYRSLGVQLVCRMRFDPENMEPFAVVDDNGNRLPVSRRFLPANYYPFDAQPLPWAVCCPLYPLSSQRARFVLVAQCVLEQQASISDANGRRGLVVTVANGVYDRDSDKTDYGLLSAFIEPPASGEQSPQLNDHLIAAGSGSGSDAVLRLPGTYHWINNGYQPSTVATFFDGQALSINRHYATRMDIDDDDGFFVRGKGFDQTSVRHNVHVFASLIDEGGVVAEVDLLPPGTRYTPGVTPPSTVFYDAMLGVDTDRKQQGVAIALGFHPGWLVSPPYAAQPSRVVTFFPQTAWRFGSKFEFEILAENYLWNVPDRWLYEPVAGHPRMLGVATISREGALTVSTSVTPTALYPLNEARTLDFPLAIAEWFGNTQLEFSGPAQQNLQIRGDSVPATTQGVTYIGKGRYVFLAATDLEGFRRTAVVYDSATQSISTRGMVFDAGLHVVRTAAGRINCIRGEDSGDDAVLISSHSDEPSSLVWPIFQGQWKDGINGQGGGRGSGELGVTFISYDSGWTWDKLADVGSYPGGAAGFTLNAGSFVFETSSKPEPDPEDEER